MHVLSIFMLLMLFTFFDYRKKREAPRCNRQSTSALRCSTKTEHLRTFTIDFIPNTRLAKFAESCYCLQLYCCCCDTENFVLWIAESEMRERDRAWVRVRARARAAVRSESFWALATEPRAFVFQQVVFCFASLLKLQCDFYLISPRTHNDFVRQFHYFFSTLEKQNIWNMPPFKSSPNFTWKQNKNQNLRQRIILMYHKCTTLQKQVTVVYILYTKITVIIKYYQVLTIDFIQINFINFQCIFHIYSINYFRTKIDL